MPDIWMADVSEFQTNVDAPTYLASCEVIICRTYNGYRADHMMPGRRDYLRQYPFAGVGWYAYLAADVDSAAQAQGFIDTVGTLAANEWPILDLEEGSGDQTGRAQAWFDVVDDWAGFPAMLYSGDYFLSSQLGGSDFWSGRPIWVAAYGTNNGQPQNEPSQSHTLWQFSSVWTMPGVTPPQGDGNIHHDSAAEFMVSVRAGTSGLPAPTPPTPTPPVSYPPFPYPPSDYLGQPSPDPHCHSGYYGGVDNQNVAAWQAQMTARGWAGIGDIDGCYGPKSENVCRQFQAEKGLTVDGFCGPSTWSSTWTAPIS